jgi:hypothetical protein
MAEEDRDAPAALAANLSWIATTVTLASHELPRKS